MARLPKAPIVVIPAGEMCIAYTPTADGISVPADNETMVRIYNGQAAADLVVTINANRTIDGLAVPDKTITIPYVQEGETGIYYAGPYNPATYTSADGQVDIDFDATTDVTYEVFMKN
jgi:hypothetical protein